MFWRLVAPAAAALLIGCGGHKGSIVGNWKSNMDSNAVWTFKADHTVTSTGKGQVSGTWTQGKGTILIKFSSINGQSEEEFKKTVAKLRAYSGTTETNKKRLDKTLQAIENGQMFTLSQDGHTMSSDEVLGYHQVLTRQ